MIEILHTKKRMGRIIIRNDAGENIIGHSD